MATTTSSSSATSSLISSLGGGSGIDFSTLATNLAAAQFANRTDRLANKADTLDRQISAASNIKSMLLGLSTSLGSRVRDGDLSPQPKVANSSVATPSLSGSAQPRGTYSLEVTQLAKSQTLTSPAYAASTSTVGSGTLTLRFGTIAGSSFTEDTGHASVDIDIASGATLADVASAINGKRAGVTAYVANTATGAKLVLKGSEGTANGFVLDATEASGDPGLANLAWDPSGDASRLLASSGDAAFKIDGLPMTSRSNTVVDAVPGLNLALTATNIGSPTAITFADSSAAITSAMQDLTNALNEIMSEVNAATDAKTGDLARDGGATSLKRSLAALAGSTVMPTAADGSPKTLADLGLSTQRDGTYLLDTTRLTATLKADPQGVAAMFTNGLYGVYGTIDGLARKAGKASDPGTLAGSIARYTAQKRTTSEDQTTVTEKTEALRLQLLKRFSATDTAVGASKSTLSFLQNQIDAWNAQRS